MDSNIQALKIKKEQEKLKDMMQLVPGANSPMTTPGVSPTATPSPSPVPFLQSADLESKSILHDAVKLMIDMEILSINEEHWLIRHF